MKPNMKQTSLIACFLFVFSSACYSETVSISVIDWCPFICPDSQDRPGLLVEYTKAILKRSGHDIKLNDFPWSRAVKTVEEGSMDAVLAPARSEAPTLMFPDEPIGTQRQCFFSLKESAWQYDKPESVIGKKIIHPQDVLPEILMPFSEKASFNSIQYSKHYIPRAISMLKASRIDSILMTYYSMYDYLNKNQLSGLFTLSGCVASEDLFLAFTPALEKKDRVMRLMADFDQSIKALKKESFFEGLLLKYGLN